MLDKKMLEDIHLIMAFDQITRGKPMAMKKYKQSKKSKMDESLGMRKGKESTKSQSYKSRRAESTGMKKKKMK